MLRRVCGSVRFGLAFACVAFTGGLACGTQTSEPLASSEGPIIGGKLDTTHRGVVALLKKIPAGQGSGFYPSCTGSLITQNLVLTARHCVAGLTSADGTVDCSPQSITKFKTADPASSFRISIEANVGEEGLTPFKVSQVWVPQGSSNVCGTDIALMLLEGSGIPAADATTIEPRIGSPVPADDVFAAIGYGLQDPNDQIGQTAGHRMAVSDATVYCQGAECQTSLVTDDEFVAESPVCSGDSGGPALDSAGRVCGVTSRGDAQCTLAIYSSVAAWRDFIVEKTFEAAKSGQYAPPLWAGDPPPGFETGGGGSGGSPNAGGSGGTVTGNGGTSFGGGGAGPAAPGGSGGSVAGASSGGGGSGGGSVAGSSNSSAGVGAGPSSSPTIEQLGTECGANNQCLGTYKCWAANGVPPGICVPACSSAQTSCPTGYSCDTTLNACTTPPANNAEAHDDGGCSLGGAPGRGSTSAVWLGLSLIALHVARRRGVPLRIRSARP